MSEKGTFQARLVKALLQADKLTIRSFEQEKWEIRVENQNATFGALQRTRYLFKEETTPSKLLDVIENASEFLHDSVEMIQEAQAGQSDET